jgi:hypothetical protein
MLITVIKSLCTELKVLFILIRGDIVWPLNKITLEIAPKIGEISGHFLKQLRRAHSKHSPERRKRKNSN